MRHHLFLSFKPGITGEICANTISAWLKVILLAYERMTRTALLGVRAHEDHALVASWDWIAGIAVSSSLEACHWQSHSTFTSFYLRDLSIVAESVFHLGPLFVAQQRILVF